MKISFALGVAVLCAGLWPSGVRGALPAAEEPLPNYDKRVELRQHAPKSLLLMSGPGREAELNLKALLPNAKVSRDNVAGSPRLIKASQGFLTGPGGVGYTVSATSLAAIPASDPHRTVKAFLNQHAALFGHNAQALESARVTRDYVTSHNGLRTVVWEQSLDGIPVFGAVLSSHITRQGELVSIGSHFMPNAALAASVGTPNRLALAANPLVSSTRALSAAAANLGVAVPEGTILLTQLPQGAEKSQTATAANLFGPAWMQLVWLPMNQDSMRLCWRTIVTCRRSSSLERYLVLVDAESGEVLLRRSLTHSIGPATYNVYISDSPSPLSPGLQGPSSFQPTNVSRVMVITPAFNTNASPNGWIPDGDNRTLGNNAIAFRDRDLSDTPDIPLPQGVGPDRVFDFPLSLGQAPLSYANASTVQLFYQANAYHDRLYQLGFTEAAGNFQSNNFGRGGFGSDALRCLVQAGADVGFTDNAVFLSSPDGLTSYVMMFVFSGPIPDRDGSLDQEVVIHELTHGLSQRLVGGGVGIFALQSDGMGEGWSDFYSLCLLSEPTDNVDAAYAAGGYASYLLGGFPFTENYYYGIRRYPYTTDTLRNPLTFKDIDPTQADPHFGVPVNPIFGGTDPSEVHNQGEVWCVTLREVWVNLVLKHGWETGNDLALRLVTDGMKLSPVNPTFLEARDAIIQADEINNGGDNYEEIWRGFAKRGMGFFAVAPPSDTTVGVIESFALPPAADGILEVRVTPPPFEALFGGDTNIIFVRVTDAFGVTNATVNATIVGSTNLPFRNDGVQPDQTKSNAVHTATLRIPNDQPSITINLVISAPGKITSTNVITYFIVPLPPNDNFANAIKAPVGGTNYISNNKRATLESLEPIHGGIPSQAHSLWWNYTASSNGNVLVDTASSPIRTVVAVYTNLSLNVLQSVASAAGTLDRPAAFVNFSARAGATYRIAVSGYDTNNAGTLSVHIAPGAFPDTNAPTVTVTSPADGFIATTNRVLLTGSAVDPSPAPSGIQQIQISAGSTPVQVGTSGSGIIGPPSTNWFSFVGLVPGLNRIQVTAIDFAGNRSDPATVNITYRVIEPENDFFVNSSSLVATSAVSVVNTLNATKEVNEPNHAGNLGGRSAWWTFTAPEDGVLTLSTSNSAFDTVLAVYQGATVGSLSPLASNDDAHDGVRFSQIVESVKAGQTYRIAVDGYDGEGGALFLNSSFTPMELFHVVVTAGTGGSVDPVSADVASNSVVLLSAIPNANFQFDIWDGDVVSLNNPLSVTVKRNLAITAHFRPIAVTDDFESGNLRHIAWTTNGPGTGNKPWFVQGSVVAGGVFAARSGAITNGQQSSLILTANFRAGNGSFDYRVSSEPSFDQLKFLVDAAQLQQWSGDTGWGTFAFPLSAGTHTLEWRYAKDPNTSSGLDAAFIDNVDLPIVVGIDGSSPANLQLQRQSDGAFYINLTGQANQQYVLQTSTNLVDWQNVSTSIAVGGFIRIPIPSSSSPAQYYRALVAP